MNEIKEFLEQGKNIRSFVCRGAWKAIDEDRKTLRRDHGGFGGQGKISSPLTRPKQRLRISFITSLLTKRIGRKVGIFLQSATMIYPPAAFGYDSALNVDLVINTRGR